MKTSLKIVPFLLAAVSCERSGHAPKVASDADTDLNPKPSTPITLTVLNKSLSVVHRPEMDPKRPEVVLGTTLYFASDLPIEGSTAKTSIAVNFAKDGAVANDSSDTLVIRHGSDVESLQLKCESKLTNPPIVTSDFLNSLIRNPGDSYV